MANTASSRGLAGGHCSCGPDHDGDPLAVFSGLPKGGDFYFWLVDGGCGDSGTITKVGIHTLNGGGTPVEQTSWNEIKSQY